MSIGGNAHKDCDGWEREEIGDKIRECSALALLHGGRLPWVFEDATTLMLVYIALEDLRDTGRDCSRTCTIRDHENDVRFVPISSCPMNVRSMDS